MSLIIYKNKNWIGLDPFPFVRTGRLQMHMSLLDFFYFLFYIPCASIPFKICFPHQSVFSRLISHPITFHSLA